MINAQKMTDKQYLLNPNAILVKGASRSMICDLERSSYQLIPNGLHKILEDKACGSIEEVFNLYSFSEEDQKTVLEYFEVLYDKDLIFFSDFPNYYKKISLAWDYPAFITNAIIDIDEQSAYDVGDVCTQLAELGCRNIQLRSYCFFSFEFLHTILSAVKDSIIESLQFIIPYINREYADTWQAYAGSFPRIRFVQLFGADDNKVLFSDDNETTTVARVSTALVSAKCCGVISPHYFSIALSTFCESQHHNSCLNRKIAIDVEGNIKNCPSMPASFGNIRNTTIKEALEKPGFKKYWNITKDEIRICKDCEFRHVCTDCRAYVEHPEDAYSKPLKCGYNPYTCEWEEWSTNPLKQKAIQYYGMEDILLAD
jgi:SPASM domain peptide maturase of grasp-with-spasm system